MPRTVRPRPFTSLRTRKARKTPWVREPSAAEVDFPRRVWISNKSNPNFTVLEIQTIDRIGLLYDIFATIGRFGIETVSARINTEKGAAVDSFYLSDIMGRKVEDSEQLANLKIALETVLGIEPT